MLAGWGRVHAAAGQLLVWPLGGLQKLPVPAGLNSSSASGVLYDVTYGHDTSSLRGPDEPVMGPGRLGLDACCYCTAVGLDVLPSAEAVSNCRSSSACKAGARMSMWCTPGCSLCAQHRCQMSDWPIMKRSDPSLLPSMMLQLDISQPCHSHRPHQSACGDMLLPHSCRPIHDDVVCAHDIAVRYELAHHGQQRLQPAAQQDAPIGHQPAVSYASTTFRHALRAQKSNRPQIGVGCRLLLLLHSCRLGHHAA